MNKYPALASLATAGLILAACGTNEPASTPIESYEVIDTPDPYTDNGIWQIPDQVQPGRYEVRPNNDTVVSLRWLQLCTDPYCEHPSNAAGSTVYAQDQGVVYVLIPDDGSVKAYENNGVRLQQVTEPSTGGVDCERASQDEWMEHCR